MERILSCEKTIYTEEVEGEANEEIKEMNINNGEAEIKNLNSIGFEFGRQKTLYFARRPTFALEGQTRQPGNSKLGRGPGAGAQFLRRKLEERKRNM